MSSEDRWSYSIGPHGAKARARERKRGGNVYLFAWDPDLGGNRKESLEFKVRDADGELIPEKVEEAEEAAKELSNRLIRGEAPFEEEEEPDATLGRVADLFRESELPSMGERHTKDMKRGLELWERFLGRSFDLRELSIRDWSSFRRARSSGEVDACGRRKAHTDFSGQKVGPRTVAKDLKILRQLCRFAERYRESGGFLLDADPTRGLELPSEKDPRRPVADDTTLEKLLKVADRVTVGHGKEKRRTPLRELLILAAHTGRRIGAIVRLRWSDWSPEEGPFGFLRWRADSDKLGRTWRAPVTPEVREALEKLRRERPAVGEAFLFPAPESEGHLRRDVANKWLRRAEELAEDHEHEEGFGWHAFRRGWATKRKHLSAKDVAHVGGWKDTATLQEVYQQPDPETMEEVVLGGRELRMRPDGDGPEDRAAGARE